MAASLSRPDPTSPASVAEAGFSTSRRGFQPDEVRAFLTSVAAEMGRLKERERQLEAELRAARASATGRVELDDETAANLLGEETLRVLQTARESASQIKVRAEDNAAKVIREAHDEANRVRQEADVEAARNRHDAQSDAEAEVALAKQQGREMVNEARAYRERVLADLERRTKVARQHIEELANGRDRLLQVFERARLVAVDITADLQRVDGPDEFVNFSPTTGPVPLMVPASRLAPTDDELDAMDDEAESLGRLAEQPGDPALDQVDEPSDEELAEVELEVETDPDTDINTDIDTESASEAVAAPKPDTNVVALFPGRADSAEPAESADPAKPDVDDIFARLRTEVDDVADEAASDTAVATSVDVEDPAAEATPFRAQ